MATKRENRIESKKRKAAAFLSLVQKQIEEEERPLKVLKQDGALSKLSCFTGSGDVAETSTATTSKASQHGAQQSDPDKSAPVTDKVLSEYKRLRRERMKQSMQQRPKLFTTLDDLTRDFPSADNGEGVKKLPPLYMMDLQHLLLYGLMGVVASIKPRWCRLLRVTKVTKVAVVILDSVNKEDYTEDGSFPTLKAAFDVCVDMVSPAQYGSTVREDLLTVPLSETQMRKLNWDKNKVNKVKEVLEVPKLLDAESESKTESTSTYFSDKFDRTTLLLSSAQMILEGYPMPVICDQYKDFIFTRDHYDRVTEKSPMYAIDCEMCMTVTGKNELTRVSLVNEKLEVLYDTLVKPYNKVVNYLTRYSGITKAMLDPVTTRIEEVQREICRLLPADAIVCGQSLGCDLRCLKLFHPYVIDTSVIYNLTGNRMLKTGLKRLSNHFLGENIQNHEEGHCSVEDSLATMKLVLLKLRNDLFFGDAVMGGDIYPLGDDDQSVVSTESDTFVPNSFCSCDKTGTSQSDRQCKCGRTGNQSIQASSNTFPHSGFSNKQTDLSNSDSCSKFYVDQINLLKRRKLFFQRAGKDATQDFFSLLQQQSKSGLVLDDMGSPQLYAEGTPLLECRSDRDCRKQAKSSIRDHDFTMIHLYGYRNHLQQTKEEGIPDTEARKKCLLKLDACVWKVMKKMPSMSLFVVVLPGVETEDGAKTAMTFAKIT